jgi:hypothetical protein
MLDGCSCQKLGFKGDKCCNNFVFVCKKFYVSSVFSELNSPVGAYVCLSSDKQIFLSF